jgi:hypothetical protein
VDPGSVGDVAEEVDKVHKRQKIVRHDDLGLDVNPDIH